MGEGEGLLHLSVSAGVCQNRVKIYTVLSNSARAKTVAKGINPIRLRPMLEMALSHRREGR